MDFKVFPGLPTDIRLIIWETFMLLESNRRVIPVGIISRERSYPRDPTEPEHIVPMPTLQSPLLVVNMESRKAAQKFYQDRMPVCGKPRLPSSLWRMLLAFFSWCPDKLAGSGISSNGVIYLNLEHDILWRRYGGWRSLYDESEWPELKCGPWSNKRALDYFTVIQPETLSKGKRLLTYDRISVQHGNEFGAPYRLRGPYRPPPPFEMFWNIETFPHCEEHLQFDLSSLQRSMWKGRLSMRGRLRFPFFRRFNVSCASKDAVATGSDPWRRHSPRGAGADRLIIYEEGIRCCGKTWVTEQGIVKFSHVYCWSGSRIVALTWEEFACGRHKESKMACWYRKVKETGVGSSGDTKAQR